MMPAFDSRLSAERQRDRPLIRMGRPWSEPPEDYFHGNWENRNLLNSPGPFYGADTDTCLDGPPLAPASLLCDLHDQGFVWRQPRTDAETLALMAGASSDPFNGFGWDGDKHWTPDGVRAWWAGRRERAPLVASLISELTDRGNPNGIPWAALAAEYREYLAGELDLDLRRYLYFLEAGRYPASGEDLPKLLCPSSW